MASVVVNRRTAEPESLADVLHRLGDIPIDRIGLPLGTATEADVIRHLDGDNKRIYELVDGFLVEKVVGMHESMIGAQVVRHLAVFLDQYDLGVPFMADGPIRTRKGRVRFPDTGFVSWDRLPGGELPPDPILDVAPDLAVEVISEGNTDKEMELKLAEYFKAGVRFVWYIYPETQTAIVHSSPQAKKVLGKDGVLDGGKVLPGFRLPVKKPFAKARRRD